MKRHIYDTKNETAFQFSRFLAELIEQHEEVHIALSGGSTPKIVFDTLAESFKDAIAWGRLHLYWGDERCVPPTDPESNYGMTNEHLLSKITIPGTQVHRIHGEDEPDHEAKRYGELLTRQLPQRDGIPQFDLVILGMGDDGHTASIFPDQIALWNSVRNCEVATHPESGQYRITITGRIINNAKSVAFLVTGGDKAEKVAEILGGSEERDTYPAALVAPYSGELHWFLDAAAAKGLSLDPA